MKVGKVDNVGNIGKEGKRRSGRSSVGNTAWEAECDGSALSRMEPKVQTGLLHVPNVLGGRRLQTRYPNKSS